LSNLDFTLLKYKKLCEAIAASKYTGITLADYLRLEEERRNILHGSVSAKPPYDPTKHRQEYEDKIVSVMIHLRGLISCL